MSFLLLPQDEMVLFRYLCEELGLALLLSDVTEQGAPRVALQPLTAISDRLPRSTVDPSTLIFWCRDLGQVKVLADAPEPVDAADRVAGLLTREAAGSGYGDVIDLCRTPVIRWVRARYRRDGQLMPGLLQAMPLSIRDTPPGVMRLHRNIDRWLKKRGEKVNPFEHCCDATVSPPRNLNVFWVWVHPHAMEWIKGGGEMWPWTG
jgi:hypothetical protein